MMETASSGQIKSGLRRFARIALSYTASALAAACAAAMVIAFAMALEGDPQITGAMDHLKVFLGFAITISAFAFAYVFVFALPVFVPFVAFCEWRGWRKMWMYLVAGLMATMPLYWVLSAREDIPSEFRLAHFVAGLAGGYVYWAIAGRKAGSWKRSAP